MQTPTIRIWLAEVGPAPDGWLLVLHPWHVVKLILTRPTEVAVLSIEDTPLHRALAWMIVGGKVLAELPATSVPAIEVRT